MEEDTIEFLEMSVPRFGREATTTALALAASVFAALTAAPLATAQCANLAGNWNASESGTLTLSLTASDGESGTNTYPVSGSGVVTITKTGPCTFQYPPILPSDGSLLNSGLTPAQLATLVRTVTVNGDNATETGIFAVINYTAAEQNGLAITSVTGNTYTGTGQVDTNAGPYSMTLKGSADMVINGTYEGYTFALTVAASTTATFRNTSEPPIIITPPSQTSIASGSAYKGTFTATGGSGAGYTWSVISGSLPDGFSLNEDTGVLSSPGSPAATQGSYPFTVQVTDSANDTQTQVFTLNIGCAGINLLPYPGAPVSDDGHPTSMNANFTPTDASGSIVTLATAEKACGFSGFNWQQTVEVSPNPNPISACSVALPKGGSSGDLLCQYARSNPGQPLVAPYSDPPSGGGYTYESTPDNAFPFYLTSAEVGALSTAYSLAFLDRPVDPVLDPQLQAEYDFQATATADSYQTSLVGMLPCGAEGQPACGTPSAASAPLFTWTWMTTFNGTSGGVKKVKNLGPVDPGSGTGGITVISINGVPTPKVTVTPSSTSITTGQALPVSVTVAEVNSSLDATGSVQLSSGNFKSASIVLSYGTATITVPAGSLATGSDTLTVVYTPDKSSAALLSASSGFALVTVVQSPPAATPMFSPAPGAPTPAETVKISDSTPNATIYYTLDGSAPTDNSIKYTSPLAVAKTTTIKAIAEAAGYPNSAVATATYTILKPQTITFTAPASPVTYGVKPIALVATASSGLAVKFSVVSGPGKLNGSTLIITGAGTVVVAANQAGNSDYTAAPQVKQSILVNKSPQTIDFAPFAGRVTYGVKPITLSATASSGLKVSYKVSAGPATVSGSTLRVTGAGAVGVVAMQVGNSDYAPAKQVARQLDVDKATLTVAANNLSMKQGAAVPTLTYSMTGFVNKDTQHLATTGQLRLTTTATSTSKPGKYPITVKPGTLKAANYVFAFVAGTLTVQ